MVPIGWASLVYLIIVNSFYGALLLAASWEMLQNRLKTTGESLWRVLGSTVAPSISMIAPAHNEARTIAVSVRSLLSISYPNLEVVVVNDGSTDNTLEELTAHFKLVPIHPIYQEKIITAPVLGLYRSLTHPNLLVADKENGGGKADALNAALNLASGELVCAIDADTLIEPDAMQRMVRPFLTGKDVLAAGGTIRLVNACEVRAGRVTRARVPRNYLSGFQVVEYLRAFLFGRLGWNLLGGNLIISGAFGLFRRDAVVTSGGYAHDTVGEDMEMILKLRSQGYENKTPARVVFIPDPVAWTEAPESLSNLANQRERWHRGLSDVLWRYRRVMLNPKYGTMGLVSYPYFLFVELLSPVIELLGLIVSVLGLAFGVINLPFAVLFLLAAYGYGMILTLLTVLMEEIIYHRYDGLKDRGLIFTWALLESFGYRQITVLWRLRGLLKHLGRRKSVWGAMERKGFGTPGV